MLIQVAGDEMPVSPRTINPSIDHRLEAICRKCLEKQPENRYDSMDDLAQDLENYLGNRRSTTWEFTTRDFLRSVFQSKYPATEFAGVYWLVILYALSVLPWHIWQYWLIQYYQSEVLLWISCFVQYGFVIALQWYLRVRSQRPPTTAEYLIHNVWRGTFLVKLTILLTARLTFESDFSQVILLTYPAVLATLGMTYFIQASIYWPGDFLYSALYFLTALLITVHLEFAPLAMGILASTGNVHLGLGLWRIHRSLQEKSEQDDPFYSNHSNNTTTQDTQ